MKKVTIISSSFRNPSSSKKLAFEMMKGIKKNNEVSLIELDKINFNFCKGCLACQKTGKCIINDDIKNIIKEIQSSDILVFVTPIYFYSISGQLKTFLDRLNPLFVSKENKFKEVYALFTCADDNLSAIEGPIKALNGWIECFENVKFINSFNGLSITNVNDISKETLEKAYEFGKEIK